MLKLNLYKINNTLKSKLSPQKLRNRKDVFTGNFFLGMCLCGILGVGVSQTCSTLDSHSISREGGTVTLKRDFPGKRVFFPIRRDMKLQRTFGGKFREGPTWDLGILSILAVLAAAS